jgi:hypothetical protein
VETQGGPRLPGSERSGGSALGWERRQERGRASFALDLLEAALPVPVVVLSRRGGRARGGGDYRLRGAQAGPWGGATQAAGLRPKLLTRRGKDYDRSHN